MPGDLQSGRYDEMSTTVVALLARRGVISLPGPDAVDFLDNLVTNDVAGMAAGGP